MQYLETTLDDSLEDIFSVGKESFHEFYPRDKFLKRLEGKRYWVYVAREKGIVGFKIFYEDNDGQIYDWLDGVRLSHRRRGIATKLMNMEIDFSRKNGYSKVKLKTHEGHPERPGDFLHKDTVSQRWHWTLKMNWLRKKLGQDSGFFDLAKAGKANFNDKLLEQDTKGFLKTYTIAK